ncbi:hypothetical protein NEDG_00536 [Nematocida displodere]|uniref:AN1-type domain-containing protein n=1 Tax=Nematocida displodere TaxID=1805483 RepID=A0A177EBS5_9MICR|nr:hypothetical protein NEDG_00536 [Nematocida displodere]
MEDQQKLTLYHISIYTKKTEKKRMESGERCVFSQVGDNDACSGAERTVSIKIVYNYAEESVLVSASADIVDEIKKKAHELFSLSCIRLEIDGRPLKSADQIFGVEVPVVSVIGIKKKCAVGVCKNSAGSSLQTTCKFCTKNFCIRHSIPEEHTCENLSMCKAEAVQENLEKLLSGKSRGRSSF